MTDAAPTISVVSPVYCCGDCLRGGRKQNGQRRVTRQTMRLARNQVEHGVSSRLSRRDPYLSKRQYAQT